MKKRSNVAAVASCVLALLACSSITALAQTSGPKLSTPVTPMFVVYDDPVELKWPEGSAKPKKPLMPLLTSWDNKGFPDLLVGEGGGRIWLVRLEKGDKGVALKSAEPLKVGDRDIQVGGACQPNWVDINGDGKPELVLAWERCVMVFPNSGTRDKPALGDWTFLRNAEGPVTLPEKTGGRLEVFDFNRDGLPDLITADFQGVIYVFLASGRKENPQYGKSASASGTKEPMKLPYVPYVRFFDFNADGMPDMLVGRNWGFVSYFRNTSDKGMPAWCLEERLQNRDGQQLDARKLTTDCIHPALGRLSGGRTPDMIFGGMCDKLFFAKGLAR
jgi:hypothetical protein